MTKLFIQLLTIFCIIFAVCLTIIGCSATPNNIVIQANPSQLALNVNDFPMGWSLTKEATESGYFSRYFSQTDSMFPKSVVFRLRVFSSIEQAKNEYTALLSSTKYSYSQLSDGDEAIKFESNDWYCTRFRVANVVGYSDVPKVILFGVNAYVNSLGDAEKWAGQAVDKIERQRKLMSSSSPSLNSTPGSSQSALPTVDLSSKSPTNDKVVLFQDNFSIFDTIQWNNATYLPLYSGPPQNMEATNIDGKDVINLQTNDNGQNNRRGIGTASPIELQPNTNVIAEMAFKPIGNLDVVAELWLFDQSTSKYVRITPYAGNFGAANVIYTEISGQEQRSSPSGIFNWNEWLILRIECKDNITSLSLLDDSQNILWTTSYDVALSNIVKNPNICLSQYLGQPGSGMWQLNSYIDYIKIYQEN